MRYHTDHGNAPSTDADGARDVASRWDRLALSALVAGTVCMIALLMARTTIGIDFTDEGFHLNWLAHPRLYPASVTQFGFIYHPLYQALHGDIAAMRQFNLLVTLALGWGLFAALFHAQLHRESGDRWPTAALGFVFSATTLTLLYQWLPTPNYRSLTLQSLLIVGIGALLIDAPRPRTRVIAWILLGVGGWLTFMAKPTSAVALAIIVGVTLVLLRHGPRRMLLLTAAVAAALLVISAFVIDGSVPAFIHRFVIGAEDLRRLQGGYTLREILRINIIVFTPLEGVTLALSAAVIAFGTAASFSPARRRRWGISIVLAVGALAAAAILVIARPWQMDMSSFLGMQFLAVLLGAGLVLRWMASGPPRPARAGEVPLWRCFLVVPYAYVFGTNGNYWASMSPAVVFWVVFSIGLLIHRAPRRIRWWNLLPMAFATQMVVAVILLISADFPFRQVRPLRLQGATMRIPASNTSLRVSNEVARYVATLDSITAAAGFRRGDAMLDFTGRFPTALYLIDARAIGLGWLAGGYPGSTNVISAGLDRVPGDQLRQAWVLAEPNGPRHVPSELLARYGLDLERDYDVVGTLRSPMGEYLYRRDQIVYRSRALSRTR